MEHAEGGGLLAPHLSKRGTLCMASWTCSDSASRHRLRMRGIVALELRDPCYITLLLHARYHQWHHTRVPPCSGTAVVMVRVG